MTPLRSDYPTQAQAAAAGDQENDEVSLLAIGQLVLRHRRLVFGCGLAMALLVILVTLVRPRTYTSSMSFMPQSTNNNLSRLSGFAAQFGFAMPSADPGASPAFYASFVKSNEVLRRVVLTPYDTENEGRPVRASLVTILDASGRTPEQQRDDAVKTLLENMHVTAGRETGVVGIEVTTPFPKLSQDVARRLIQLVSEFNLQRRQTNASAERRFVEGRLREARDSFQLAQSYLQNFLQRNRDFRNAPSLTFEYDRLQRDVQLRQEVYTTLAQSYEQARIDEVRNTPVLTIVESPDLPSRPDPRWALVKGMLGLIVGLVLGAFVAAFGEVVAPASSVDAPANERSLRHELAARPGPSEAEAVVR